MRKDIFWYWEQEGCTKKEQKERMKNTKHSKVRMQKDFQSLYEGHLNIKKAMCVVDLETSGSVYTFHYYSRHSRGLRQAVYNQTFYPSKQMWIILYGCPIGYEDEEKYQTFYEICKREKIKVLLFS